MSHTALHADNKHEDDREGRMKEGRDCLSKCRVSVSNWFQSLWFFCNPDTHGEQEEQIFCWVQQCSIALERTVRDRNGCLQTNLNTSGNNHQTASMDAWNVSRPSGLYFIPSQNGRDEASLTWEESLVRGTMCNNIPPFRLESYNGPVFVLRTTWIMAAYFSSTIDTFNMEIHMNSYWDQLSPLSHNINYCE